MSLAFNFQIAKSAVGTTYNVTSWPMGQLTRRLHNFDQHVGNLYGLTGNISDSTVVIMKVTLYLMEMDTLFKAKEADTASTGAD